MGKQYSNLTKAEYDRIKLLCNIDELSINKVAKIVGRSGSTVHMIDKSTDFENYKQVVKEHRYRYANNREKKAEASSETTSAISNLDNEHADRLTNALNRLASALETDTTVGGYFTRRGA